jgi:hypothetical protein
VYNRWFAFAFRTMQLGFEAQQVIALRMMRVVAGGTLEQGEARRMVAEKSAAFAEAQATAVLAVVKGRKDTVIAGKVLRVVKKRVRANKRRLSRAK